jgi:ATP-dependent DNA helicase RecG
MYPVEVGEKAVWVIDVLAGKNKPYVFSGAVYIREGSNTQKLTTAEEMRSFFQQSECIFFDEIPCRKFNMERDLDTEFVAEFKMMAGYHQDISNEHLFNNLKLYTEEGYFKNGAALFFGKRPDDLLDSAFVRCVLFDGVDKRYIEDDKRMYGPLYRQYEQALTWLKKHLKVRYDIEGQGGRPRKEIWEIPEVAMKEALVNALAHRDYYDKGARITVELYDDRLVVTNPGGLIGSVPPETFGTISRSRNPLVFGMMERIRMVEYIGSGVMRMRKAMKEATLPQPDFELKGTFCITLEKQKGFFIEPEEKSELSDIQNRALTLIKANSSITSNELSDALLVGSRHAQKIIKYLKDTGYIEREGSRKTGIWIMKNKMA